MWLFRGGSSSSRHDDEYESSSSYDSQEYENSDELLTSEEEDGGGDEYEEDTEEQQEHEEEMNDEEPYETMDNDDDDEDDDDDCDDDSDVSTNETDSSDNDDERAETNDSRLSKQDEETNDDGQQQNGGSVEEQEQQQEKVVHGQYGEETKGRETTTSRSCNDETLENDVDNMDDKRSGEDLAHDESEEEEENSDDESDDESESDDEDDDDDAITSLQEKQALLALAAENDRVDIIKAILTDQDKNALLHPTTTATATDNATILPPLHVAISYGSTNATSCLLRMGANPAVRLPPTNYGGLSAWELLWNDSHNHHHPAQHHRTVSPSKQQGMLHAFTAEALRCIGSDDVERLQHLLDSGMPMTTEIGDRDLYGWSVEMAATKCQQVLKPPPLAENGDEQQQQQQQQDDDKVRHREGGQTQTTTASSSFSSGTVVSRPGRASKNDSEWSLQHNRLEELESLGRALSVCLDNLAEEVSVCHGLLLLGGGASALASHVRSLKVLKEKREVELEKWTLDWEDCQDELAYWLQQSGGSDGFDDFSMTMMETTDAKSLEKKRSFTTPENKDEEEAQRRQLKAQIAASENKVRKLRASIADLSEENARDLVEVEKRGLSGGIKLVRTLREELREVEFHLSEAKSGTASCRARVNLIVARLEGEKKNGNHAHANDAASSPAAAVASESRSAAPNGGTNGRQERALSSLFADDDDNPSSSDKIASGDSEAIALRPAGGNRGYLPIDLWDIILRIIGLGRVAVKKSVRDNTPSAMII